MWLLSTWNVATNVTEELTVLILINLNLDNVASGSKEL